MRVLSHPLGTATPPVGHDPPVVVEPVTLIADGEPFNIHRLTLTNHIGTHLDAPWHVNPEGPRVTDLEPAWFAYTAPRLVDIAKTDDELITSADLEPHAGDVQAADLILVRTGFATAARAAQPRRYGTRSPGFASDAAEFFLELPQLRAVGIDSISATAPSHPAEGLAFHRRMLGQDADDRFILLIEDVLLPADLAPDELSNGVYVVPLLLDALDGAPVTVLAV